MFSVVGDIITLKWIREHPIVMTSFAAAAAVYSYATSAEETLGTKRDSMEEFGRLEVKPPSQASRSISWGDERGGKLAQFIEEPHVFEKEDDDDDDEDDEENQAKEEEQETKKKHTVFHKTQSKGVLLEPKCLTPFNSNSSDSLAARSETSATNFNSVDIPKEDEDDEPPSPQWGWFVTMTPPQNNMFESSKAVKSS